MVNIIGVRPLVPPLVGDNDSNSLLKMTARAVLQCRPNSHPFPERALSLEQAVKIGRAVARARPSTNNAIFDCKVLSRNHAVLWFENGKFYLQDTKSSNGTFVNNRRLSKGSEESVPHEVCSGDIVQFGVDVLENSRKVTHGCIIATLKLYMPDGQEAKASPSTMVGNGICSMNAQELYQLRTYLQEAQHREQLIESKLSSLREIMSSTQMAAMQSWSAMIDEDRLLQRLETLEGQLSIYSKNYPEDTFRDEIKRILEEKGHYETSAKESLQRILKEKLDAITKCTDLEREMSTTTKELRHMEEVAQNAQKEVIDLLLKQTAQSEEIQSMTEKLKAAEEDLNKSDQKENSIEQELEIKLQGKNTEERKLTMKIECLQAESDFTKEQLSAIKAKYENIKNGQFNLLFNSELEAKDFDEKEIKKVFMVLRKVSNAIQDRIEQAKAESIMVESSMTYLKDDIKTAKSIHENQLNTKNILLGQMNNEMIKKESSLTLANHLKSKMTFLKSYLNDYSEAPRIYEDLYEENSLSIGRHIKRDCVDDDISILSDQKGENKASRDFDPDDESISISDNTLTEKKIFEEDEMENLEKSGIISYINGDIEKIEDMLSSCEEAKESAENQIESITKEMEQFSDDICSSSDVFKLQKELAVNELLLKEKTETITSLQSFYAQLESSVDLAFSHLNILFKRISQEKDISMNVKNEVEEYRKKFKEANNMSNNAVAEIEILKKKIDSLQICNSFPSENYVKAISSKQVDVDKRHEEGLKDLSSNLIAHATENYSAPFEVSSHFEEVLNEDTCTTSLISSEVDKELKLRGLIKSTESDKTHNYKEYAIVVDLKKELKILMEQNKFLKEELSHKNEDFSELTIQSKLTAVVSMTPLFILFIGFVFAFYNKLSIWTATYEPQPYFGNQDS